MSAPARSRPALILLLITLACHALLPFTDYVCYDDLWIMNWVHQKHFSWLHSFFSQAGTNLGYVVFSAFAFVGNLPTTFKIVAVVLSFLTGWFAYLLAERSRFLSASEALFVGAFTIAFPAFKLNGGFVYSAYELTPCVFLFAVLVVLRSEALSGWRHAVLRVAALLLFAFSFWMPSLLMFYGGFFWLMVLMHQRDQALPWYRIPWRFCKSRLDYLVLPFVYWFGKAILNPTWGPLADYNKPSLSLSAFAAGYKSLLKMLVDPFQHCWAMSPGIKFALLGCAALLCLTTVRFLARYSFAADLESEPRKSSPLGLLAFGVVLLFLGTAPYLAVKKYFSAFGVLSSYTPLIPLPTALIAVALIRVLYLRAPRLTVLMPMGLALALMCGVTTWWHNYLALQAVKVRNESIMYHVRTDPAVHECTVYCVYNRFRIPRTPDDIHTWLWSYLECGLEGEPRSIAFNGLPPCPSITEDEVKQYIVSTTLPWAMTEIDPVGKQGLLLISQKPGFESITSAALKYLYYKNFAPARLAPFLESATEVHFLPTPWQIPVQVD